MRKHNRFIYTVIYLWFVLFVKVIAVPVLYLRTFMVFMYKYVLFKGVSIVKDENDKIHLLSVLEADIAMNKVETANSRVRSY